MPLVGDSEPKETGPLPTSKSRSLLSPVTVHAHIPPKNGRTHDVEHHATGEACDSCTRIMGHQSPLPKHPQTNMYLPKFLAGEAFEVVNRNTGCSYDNLLKTLEGRFGQAVQVTQACIVIT